MLRNPTIYWIGGSSCAGKSTLAQIFAKKYEFELYSCDDHFNEHLKSISVNDQPAMYKVSTMNANEAFYTRNITEQLKVYIQSFNEDFPFVINDLKKIGDKPIVVEGNQLLPSLVFPFFNVNHKSLWIIPTEDFQREYYRKRDWIYNVLRNTDNPDIAFDNWMIRDSLFAKLVYQEATNLKLNLLQVDGKKSINENFEILEILFT